MIEKIYFQITIDLDKEILIKKFMSVNRIFLFVISYNIHLFIILYKN